MEEVEQYLEQRLEEDTLEDIFEDFDLDPLDVLMFLWQEGWIDLDP